MTRLVIDASIWLPAFLGPDESPPRSHFRGTHGLDVRSIARPLLLDEVRRGLAKPYFRHRLPVESADRLMRALTRASAQLPRPKIAANGPARPNRRHLVALATIARS